MESWFYYVLITTCQAFCMHCLFKNCIFNPNWFFEKVIHAYSLKIRKVQRDIQLQGGSFFCPHPLSFSFPPPPPGDYHSHFLMAPPIDGLWVAVPACLPNIHSPPRRTLILFRCQCVQIKILMFLDSLATRSSHGTQFCTVKCRWKSLSKASFSTPSHPHKTRQLEEKIFVFLFSFCPSFFLLSGMWTWCLETEQPSWEQEDQSHMLRMGEWEGGGCPSPWAAVPAPVLPALDLCLFKPSLVEFSVPCSYMPS